MADEIAGLHALVTGGGSGIGLATAKRLAADGAVVTICGRTAEKLEAAVAHLGADARWIVGDVTDEEQLEAAVARAAEDSPSGGLDILVANAGGSLHMGPIAE